MENSIIETLEEACVKYYEDNIDQSNIPREHYEQEIQDLMIGFAYKWKQERVCNCGLKESEHNVRHPFIPRQETPNIPSKFCIPNKHYISNDDKICYETGYLDGAKWQQEKSYNKEEIIPLLNAIQYFVDRVENGTIRSKTTYRMYKELLEQFKK